jgi:hypothetical protein
VTGSKIDKVVPACPIIIFVIVFGSIFWLVSERISTELSVRIVFTVSPFIGAEVLDRLISRIKGKLEVVKPPKELSTTLSREIEDWPEGVRKQRKRFSKS